jgi:hypothetical protein
MINGIRIDFSWESNWEEVSMGEFFWQGFLKNNLYQ